LIGRDKVIRNRQRVERQPFSAGIRHDQGLCLAGGFGFLVAEEGK